MSRAYRSAQPARSAAARHTQISCMRQCTGMSDRSITKADMQCRPCDEPSTEQLPYVSAANRTRLVGRPVLHPPVARRQVGLSTMIAEHTCLQNGSERIERSACLLIFKCYFIHHSQGLQAWLGAARLQQTYSGCYQAFARHHSTASTCPLRPSLLQMHCR